MRLAIASIGELPSLSLTEVDNSWTTTRRYDTKFILERTMLDLFFRDSSISYSALEVNDARAFTYRTTYFDTPDLLLYRDHAQRRRRRVKVRTRQYIESDRVRLEVKAKLGNGQTQKTFFENVNGIEPSDFEIVNGAIHDIHSSKRFNHLAENLLPTAVNTFQRSTLINQGAVERITLDSGLILETDTKSISMNRELVLVEIKSPQRMSQTVRQLRQSGIHPTSFSKYCAAIELTQDLRPRVHDAEKLHRAFDI